MGKQLFSILFITCFISVSWASVIHNHLNNVGVNANSNSVNEKNPSAKDKNPLEICKETCLAKKAENHLFNVGVCKFDCNNKNMIRTEQIKFNECLGKCSNVLGEPQAPATCECRQTCEKSYPKTVLFV